MGDECARIEPHAARLPETFLEGRFERIIRLAKLIFDVPVARVSLFEDGPQGLVPRPQPSPDAPQPRIFCAHAILGKAPLIVADARLDARFASDAAVTAEPGIRFYAGHPVFSPEGDILATLSVMDTRPRRLSDRQIEALRDLAHLVEEEIGKTAALSRSADGDDSTPQRVDPQQAPCADDARSGAILNNSQDALEGKAAERKLEEKLQLLEAVLETVDVGVIVCTSSGELTIFNRAAREFHGMTPESVNAQDWGRHYEIYAADGETGLAVGAVPLYRALQGEIVENAETMLIARKQAPRFLLASGRPLFNASGEKLGAVVAIKDVTELKESERRLAVNEQRLRSITENLPALIGHVDKDERFLFLNSKAASKLFRGDGKNLIGSTVRSGYGEVEYARVKPYLDRVLAGEKVSFEREYLTETETFYYQTSYFPDIDASGAVIGFYAVAMDVTARKVSELRRAESEERLSTIADNLPVLIAYVDEALRYRFANAQHANWYGIQPREMLGRAMTEVFGVDVFDSLSAYASRCLSGETVRFEQEMMQDGAKKIVESLFIPQQKNGSATGIYILATDVTERRKQEMQLQLAASTDPLTGLPNRRSFEEKLQEAELRASRSGRGIALMFLDVDFFKEVNDTFGHAGGDALLQELAARLKSSVRATDTVCRLAGDEFVVILEGLQQPIEAGMVAEKILASIRMPFSLSGMHKLVSASIGIAFTLAGATDMKTLSAHADAALYQAKAAGRNAYHIYASDGASPVR